ncbi:hypothetical protein STRCI_001296 [Streptomyces cinnabarinus]|uniref:Mobile element transfer n=1 Tax=Streptomyces cinnabarinus TaxID=67287 RepID=A0ABY7KB82_9ACTN|nr:hypothetical protein [Streptomyces cinnabarinus]WAZ20196.1 hypothetical protein STRCI_001296 [Streptomyces cinnabarinus]
MAIGYAHTLFCDRPGCRAKVTVADTRNAAHARRVAHASQGWRCDRAGDFCPNDRTTGAKERPVARQGASR